MWYDRVTVVFLLRFLGYIEFTHIEEILQFDTESACWVPLMGPRTLRAAERLSLYQDNLSGEPRVAQGPAQIPPQRLTSQNARFWFSIIGPAPGTANIEQLLLDRERREAQGEEPLLPHEEMTLPQRDYTRIPGAWPYMDSSPELSLQEAQDRVIQALENVSEPAPPTDWPRLPQDC